MEVAELLLDLQSYDSMLKALKVTFTHLSRLENLVTLTPSTTSAPSSHHHHQQQEKKKNSKGGSSKAGSNKRRKKKIEECGRSMEEEDIEQKSAKELAHEFREFWEREEVKMLREETKFVNTAVYSWFWHKMQQYRRLTDDDKANTASTREEATAFASVVTVWTQWLATHACNCWCRCCKDAETQRLALTLAGACLKVVHALSPAPAESYPERFFTEVLGKMRMVVVNHGGEGREVMAMLHSCLGVAVVEGEGEENLAFPAWDLCLLAVDMSRLLAEMELCRGNVTLALAHTREGILTAKSAPSALPKSPRIRTKILQLESLCLHLLVNGKESGAADRGVGGVVKRGGFDPLDAWCWLSAASLEVQVRQQLDQLKKVAPASEKLSQISSSSSNQQIEVVRAGGDDDDSDFGKDMFEFDESDDDKDASGKRKGKGGGRRGGGTKKGGKKATKQSGGTSSSSSAAKQASSSTRPAESTTSKSGKASSRARVGGRNSQSKLSATTSEHGDGDSSSSTDVEALVTALQGLSVEKPGKLCCLKKNWIFC